MFENIVYKIKKKIKRFNYKMRNDKKLEIYFKFR